MALLQRIARQGHCRVLQRAFSAEAAAGSKKFYDVPEGHIDSDLSQIACNIGLNRRRDLKLGAAGNIKLVVGGTSVPLSELFKDQLTVLFGVPDRGDVCTKTHVPGYLKELEGMRRQGVTQIICVSRGDAAEVDTWAKENGIGSDITVAADPNGGFTRILGMEVDSNGSGPASLRYSVALEDGVILKVLVEESLGKVDISGGSKMLEFLKSRPQAPK
ncbi:hypothetical protein M9435_006540 [Picochlorum sp. BPE23]|nr:hypothetical protein M9435_006540 [Picochlorum sp. BPE23]